MARRRQILIVVIPAAGLLFFLYALGDRSSEQPGQRPARDGAVVDDSAAASPEIRRGSAGHSSETDSAVPSPSAELNGQLLSCFQLPEDQFANCLLSIGVIKLDPAELAWVFRSFGFDDLRCRMVFRESLLSVQPSDLLSYIDEFCIEIGESRDLHYALESVVITLMATREGWSELIAASLNPLMLFAQPSTEGPIIVAARIAKQHRNVEYLLQEGARGGYGGSSEQILRALTSCTALLEGDSLSAIAFLDTVVQSATLPDDPVLGGMLVALLSFPQNWPAGDPSTNCELIYQVLSDLRFRDQAARQLYSQYGVESPPGIDPSLWTPIKNEIRLLLGK